MTGYLVRNCVSDRHISEEVQVPGMNIIREPNWALAVEGPQKGPRGFQNDPIV
jgi:hypothetical protein